MSQLLHYISLLLCVPHPLLPDILIVQHGFEYLSESAEYSLNFVNGAGLSRMDVGLSLVKTLRGALIPWFLLFYVCQAGTGSELSVYILTGQAIVLRAIYILTATLWRLEIPFAMAVDWAIGLGRYAVLKCWRILASSSRLFWWSCKAWPLLANNPFHEMEFGYSFR